MFSEAYFIFAIGNISPLLAISYPNCFGKEQPYDCNKSAQEQDSNIEICGIIAGMLVVGFLADWIGRRAGSIINMSVMLIGGILLSSATGPAQTFLIVFLCGLGIFGFGVGGEYPVASSSASERAEGDPEMRKRRGETVVMVFSNQGIGNLVNTLVIIILMAIVGATGSTVDSNQATLTWRFQFIIGTIIVAFASLYRWFFLEESKVWKAERELVDHEMDVEGKPHRNTTLYWAIFKRNWSRLLITCGAWVLNDLAFYGNKLFQSTFIAVISPGATLFEKFQWTLLNSGVSLCGYWTAAIFIDKPWYGRRRMQCIGFGMMFFLFLFCGIFYDQLSTTQVHWFQALYFLSSYFNQFGPNCTTWLVAGEVFPTDVRAAFHGISAAFGKAGAIAATQLFTRLSVQNTFYVSAGAGIVGAIGTFIFLPDTTGLDLDEVDRYNMYLISGQDQNYHGEMCNPKYLSVYERLRGYGKPYSPEKDQEQRKLQHLHGGMGWLTPVQEGSEATLGTVGTSVSGGGGGGGGANDGDGGMPSTKENSLNNNPE